MRVSLWLVASVVGAMSTGVVGCGGDSGQGAPGPKLDSEPVGATSSQVVVPGLGYGFSSLEDLPVGVGSCLNDSFEPPIQAQPSGFGSINKNFTSEEIATSLGVSVEASVGWGLFSASASAKYSRDTIEVRNTLSFNYEVGAEYVAQLNHKPVGRSSLSASIQETYWPEGGELDKQGFYAACGDKVVSQLTRKAVYVVNLDVQFQSYTDKVTFESTLEASYGFGLSSIKAGLSTASSKISENAQMVFTVDQFGGQPSQLAKAFDGHFTSSCNLKDAAGIAACEAAIQKAIDYAGSDFTKQLEDPESFYIVVNETVIEAWDDIGVPVTGKPLNPEAAAARVAMGNLYLDGLNYESILCSYVSDSKNCGSSSSAIWTSLSSEERDALQALLDKAVVDNAALLPSGGGGAALCWTDAENCIAQYNKILASLQLTAEERSNIQWLIDGHFILNWAATSENHGHTATQDSTFIRLLREDGVGTYMRYPPVEAAHATWTDRRTNAIDWIDGIDIFDGGASSRCQIAYVLDEFARFQFLDDAAGGSSPFELSGEMRALRGPDNTSDSCKDMTYTFAMQGVFETLSGGVFQLSGATVWPPQIDAFDDGSDAMVCPCKDPSSYSARCGATPAQQSALLACGAASKPGEWTYYSTSDPGIFDEYLRATPIFAYTISLINAATPRLWTGGDIKVRVTERPDSPL